MPLACPVEMVRLMFEARTAGDYDVACAFLHPQIEATTTAGSTLVGIDAVRTYLVQSAQRTEVHAHRIERSGDGVIAYGRVRIVEGGSLVDSPAAWRFRLADGKVRSIAPAAL